MKENRKTEMDDVNVLGAQIFSCAVKALSCCITRFRDYSISDLLERTYQAELYAHLREEFGFDGVEAEVPYAEGSTKICDIFVYPDDDREVLLEIKLWYSPSKIDGDIQRIREALKDDNRRIGFLLNLEALKSGNITLGVSDLKDVEQERFWCSVLPAPMSRLYPGNHFACISMYQVVKNGG